MRLPPRKKIQASCRQFHGCECVDDPKTIRKRVYIELTSRCNFSCDYCSYRFCRRKKTDISLELLGKVLKDLKKIKNVDYIMLSPFGEPMLHSHFGEACRMVKRFGHRLIVTTNGSLLSKGTARLPIDEMFISMQTVTQRSFKLRGAGKLKLGEFIERICAFSRDAPFKTTLYFLRENSEIFPEYRDFISEKYRAKTVKMLEMVGKKINPVFELNVDSGECIPKVIPILPNVSFYLKHLVAWRRAWTPPGFRLVEKKSIPPCPYYKHDLSILSNGDVTFCCNDYNGDLSLGNVNEESVGEIFARKRRDIDLAEYSACRKCRGKLIKKKKSSSKQARC